MFRINIFLSSTIFWLVDIFVSGPSAYTKLDQKHCWGDHYGSFPTIQSAKDSCSNDTNCQGVYDQGCDSEADDIYLCRTSATYSDSSSSCIFQKNENGKYFISFYFTETIKRNYYRKSYFYCFIEVKVTIILNHRK